MLFAEQDPIIGTDSMPYPGSVSGPALINYRTADPQNKRKPGPGFFSSSQYGDPATPIFLGYVGDPMRVHLIGAPGSEQVKVPYLGGLAFPLDPFIPNSEVKFTRAVGPYEKFDAHTTMGGAGNLVGDMAYGETRLAYVEDGMWGLVRSLTGSNTSNCRVQANGQLAPKVLDGRICQ